MRLCGAISKSAKLGSDELHRMAKGLKEAIQEYADDTCLPKHTPDGCQRSQRPKASEPKAACGEHDRDPAWLICWTCGSVRSASMDTCIDCYSKDGLHPLHSELARGPALEGTQPVAPTTRDNLQRLVT